MLQSREITEENLNNVPKILIPQTHGFESPIDVAEAIEEYLNLPTKLQMKFLHSGQVLLYPPDQDTFSAIMEIGEIHGIPVQLKTTSHGESTHLARGVLDLSFTSTNIAQNATWTTHPYLVSDHFATCIKIHKLAKPKHNPRRNTRKAEWSLFRKTLAEHLNNTPRAENLNLLEQRLTTAFHTAANKTIPLTKEAKQHYKD
ncbi:hypothetical protein E2C01_047933 [Portunus trituberculatus]|uniref:Uncharacterized protein n=1 Tax=Portunus trituberculatus TaxID=210409 RepID=A0A5B7G926_PORTR|nr:hypothetical protein [Portunus trituberculatus]